MRKSGNYLINQLLEYGLRKGLITELDSIYCANLYIDILKESTFYFESVEQQDIYTLLEHICDYAYDKHILCDNTITTYDLFSTRLMDIMMPKPSVVVQNFMQMYAVDKIQATNYFYDLAISSNYIHMDRIAKNICYTYSCAYGILDITINLSKPEKDPKQIAQLKNTPSLNYPSCALCYENLGFAGNIKQDARQNLRVIPIELNHEKYYFQYSPYSYYNEHAILFNKNHVPMKIEKDTIIKLLDFVDQFEHYFIGSNADLPIVGGSILSHDHFQGGRYEFPMFKATLLKEYKLKKYGNTRIEYIHWPLDTLCLKGRDRKEILELSSAILKTWETYNRPSIEIISSSNGIRHNTITPIARKINEEYILYLTLRNNRVNEIYPDGIFHPRQDLHHIKKENIGLIEVMGLAVLPKRLKEELDLLKWILLKKEDISTLNKEPLLKHKAWALSLISRYQFNEDNLQSILNCEVGKIFQNVLEDCSVFKFGNKTIEMDHFIEDLNS